MLDFRVRVRGLELVSAKSTYVYFVGLQNRTDIDPKGCHDLGRYKGKVGQLKFNCVRNV